MYPTGGPPALQGDGSASATVIDRASEWLLAAAAKARPTEVICEIERGRPHVPMWDREGSRGRGGHHPEEI